jgi:hypothetical protein
MPTLARINTDIGHDLSQNKRGLNVFVQSNMKRLLFYKAQKDRFQDIGYRIP